MINKKIELAVGQIMGSVLQQVNGLIRQQTVVNHALDEMVEKKNLVQKERLDTFQS